ncbi:hypothetical protein CKO28_08930 [Rhodovibrio sodomensis]|uniref:DAGKc domain-containing protein n=1 Tax=Rhodovibrio sodomensis TaxID=1088 RepID=A0ABS1DD64_9PROT|nr:lipid kinase [Rhodovibrio sodomensis]MBK1668159.1 hypothetical protein [Rhodovibrio sodomensis]
MSRPSRILFILSRGKAERLGDRLDAIVDALGGGKRVEVEIVDNPTDIPIRIVEMSDRIDVVAIGGGDGTLSTATSALMQTGLPMAVIPLGTANDLARTLNVPLEPIAAARLAHTGRVEDIDVGSVGTHYFFNAASVGLSVDVAERLAKSSKRYGPLSYLFALWAVARTRRTFRARVRVDDEQEVVLRSIQVTVGNGVRHGGGVRIHRNACIDDGNLDLYSLEPLPFWRMILLLPAFLRGTHDGWRSVTNLRGREIALDTPGKPKRINADGEIIGRTPATFRLHRNAVLVFLPR